MTDTTCSHGRGDHVDGRWVCASCWSYLHERPRSYVMERVPSSALGGYYRGGSSAAITHRQTAIVAPIAVHEGVSLSAFINAMARRFVARTKGGMNMVDARQYAVELMRGLKEPFGSEEYGWTPEGAHEIADEDMCYWDADEDGKNA